MRAQYSAYVQPIDAETQRSDRVFHASLTILIRVDEISSRCSDVKILRWIDSRSFMFWQQEPWSPLSFRIRYPQWKPFYARSNIYQLLTMWIPMGNEDIVFRSNVWMIAYSTSFSAIWESINRALYVSYIEKVFEYRLCFQSKGFMQKKAIICCINFSQK